MISQDTKHLATVGLLLLTIVALLLLAVSALLPPAMPG
jgi:hypothetical protein